MAISFTFDLEDSRADASAAERFPAMTDRMLDFLAERGITATVFVVGELAASHPSLIERVARAGHEIGLHGLRHVPLCELDPARLAEDVRRGRALLEDATGTAVDGFRAPVFSLTPATRWALDVLAEGGFGYSSSVLPAHSPLHGFAGAPRRPFVWSNGLVELPCPVAGAGRACIPYLGGIYVRYLPMVIVRRLARRAGGQPGAWTFCHPYDFDADEGFCVMPSAGWLTSRLLHLRRRGSLARYGAVLDAGGGAGPPLRELAAAVRGDRAAPVMATA